MLTQDRYRTIFPRRSIACSIPRSSNGLCMGGSGKTSAIHQSPDMVNAPGLTYWANHSSGLSTDTSTLREFFLRPRLASPQIHSVKLPQSRTGCRRFAKTAAVAPAAAAAVPIPEAAETLKTLKSTADPVAELHSQVASHASQASQATGKAPLAALRGGWEGSSRHVRGRSHQRNNRQPAVDVHEFWGQQIVTGRPS
jgi:hypothetical protein